MAIRPLTGVFASSLFVFASSAAAQSAADLFTDGLVIVDNTARFETLRDVNGDGVLDAIGWYWRDNWVTRIGANVTLFDGRGGILAHHSAESPVFASHINLTQATASCVGDFDGNGIVEQVVLIFNLFLRMEFHPSGQITFLPAIPNPFPYWNGPSWSDVRLVVADFTGDGVDDFALANTVRLELWTYQSGAFVRLQSVPHGGEFHTTLDVGDFTGDGRPDLVQTHPQCPFGIVRVYPVANGVIGARIELLLDTCGSPMDVSVGDLDRDGLDDFVVFGVTHNQFPAGGFAPSAHVCMQTAPGVLAMGARAAPSGPSTALADVNGDGFLDGICCSGGGGNFTLLNDVPSTFEVCLNDGHGNFERSATFQGLGAHHVAGAMDFDGDGDMDIVAGRAVLLNMARVGALECAGTVNSTGAAAALVPRGSASIQRNDLVLATRNLPAGAAALTFFGSDQVAVALGNGVRCVGSSVVRLPVRVAGPTGHVEVPLDFVAGPGAGVLAGTVIHVQTWHRDSVGLGSNLSSSGRILVMP
jgi:hypothetical protein